MKRVALILLLILLQTIPVIAQQDSMISEALTRADKLYNEHLETQALQTYLGVLKSNSGNYEALWRTSYLYSRIGNRIDSKKQKIQYFNKAKEWAQKALNADSTDANSNFVISVAMGRMALISSAKARVAASRDIKHYAEQTLRYDSTYAGAWDVLGRWNYRVANLNFAEKLAAHLLFGGLPKGASNKKAIADFQKAIAYGKTDMMMYHYDLAEVYKETGKKQLAIETLNKLLKLTPVTPDDPGFVKKAHKMLNELE